MASHPEVAAWSRITLSSAFRPALSSESICSLSSSGSASLTLLFSQPPAFHASRASCEAGSDVSVGALP